MTKLTARCTQKRCDEHNQSEYNFRCWAHDKILL